MEQGSFPLEVLGTEYRGHYITDTDTAVGALASLGRTDSLLGLDLETAPLDQYVNYPEAALSPHLSKIRLLQIFEGKNSIVFDLRYIDPSIFLSFLESHAFVGHNAIFDLQFLIQLGAKNVNIACTLLLAKLIVHATRPTDIALSLEALVENVLEVKATKKVGNSDWGNEELTFEQIEYAALDPLYTLLLAEKLSPWLSKYGLKRAYKLAKDVQHPIAHMQLAGLGIDKEAHKANIAKWREDLYQAREDVLKFTGLKKLTGSTLAGWLEENLDQETLAIWPRTDVTEKGNGGKLKTDAHTFSDFSYLPIAAKYSSYQKLDKLISSFGDSLLAKINPETGRIHASYKIEGARTGRFSCSYPNLQQLPRDKTVRSIFIPDKKGEVFVSADLSQIELRCAAEISRDKAMLRAYNTGIDLHELTASKILNKPITQVTKEDRQVAKSFNFGLLFGLGSDSFSHYARKSYGVEISKEEAIRSIEIFRETYSGYRAWQLEQAAKCKQLLYAISPCGKRQRLTEANYFGTGLNHPIQSAAAEVLKHALINFHELNESNSWGYKLVMNVHDEITVQCKSTQVDECKVVLEHAMTTAFQQVFPGGETLNLVEASSGTSWGEVH